MKVPAAGGRADGTDQSIVRPEMLHLLSAAEVSEEAGAEGALSGLLPGQVRKIWFLVQVWVAAGEVPRRVWTEVEILDLEGTVLHTDALTLDYLGPALGEGDRFALIAPVPSAQETSPPREASALRYRLYYTLGGQTYTDGAEHYLELLESELSAAARARARALHPSTTGRDDAEDGFSSSGDPGD